MSNHSEDGVRRHLAAIDADRATIAHERSLLDAWEASLDREQRMASRALESVDSTGQVSLINPLTGRHHVPKSTEEQRAAIVAVFTTHGPASDRRISQRELVDHTGMSSGMVSRAVHDLEAEGRLHRVGMTPKRSPILTDIRPEADPR